MIYDVNSKNFSEVLRCRKVTANDLRKKVKITEATISRYRTKGGRIRLNNLLLIAKVLDISPSFIVDTYVEYPTDDPIELFYQLEGSIKTVFMKSISIISNLDMQYLDMMSKFKVFDESYKKDMISLLSKTNPSISSLMEGLYWGEVGNTYGLPSNVEVNDLRNNIKDAIFENPDISEVIKMQDDFKLIIQKVRKRTEVSEDLRQNEISKWNKRIQLFKPIGDSYALVNDECWMFLTWLTLARGDKELLASVQHIILKD